MQAHIAPYRVALLWMNAVVLLFLMQTIVTFIFRVKAKQTPGLPIPGGHDVFLFRADRARSNLIEVLGPFVLVLALGIALQASAQVVNIAVGLFVVGRYLHTISYYANVTVPRRIGFVMGNVATLVMVITTFRAW